MHDGPSAHLASLLERLRLVTGDQLRGVAGRARHLSGELPEFESVWVDALAQVRLLTPFQAAEINAGRGEALRVGHYVLEQPIASLGYASCYAAKHLETAQAARLVVVRQIHRSRAELETDLRRLVGQADELEELGLPAVEDAGVDGDQVWGAGPALEGRTATEWMVENGRFPPDVVVHVAREMVEQLVRLESISCLHGDIRAGALLIPSDGRLRMPHPGLRAIVRPAEGYAFNDLPPEAYDSLAPERIAEGTPPTVASEVYACGCVWWHLLTGRPPFAGGNSLAKLKAVHEARALDVRRLAPSAPAELVVAVSACMSRDPRRRPQSMRELAALVGKPTGLEADALARCMSTPDRLQLGWAPPRGKSTARLSAQWQTAAIAALVLIAIVGIGWYRGRTALESAIAERSRDTDSSTAATAEGNRNPPGTFDPAASRRLPHGRSRSTSDARLVAADDPHAAGFDRSIPPPLLLPVDRPLRLEHLDARAGQTIRGADGARVVVYVPRAGLTVAEEDVRFEGIDFVWTESSGEEQQDGAEDSPSAMIVMASQRGAFHGCSFQSRCRSQSAGAVAIRWSGPRQPGAAPGDFNGELSLKDCVFSNVAAAVEWQGRGDTTVDVTNVLHLGPGPLVHLPRCLRAGEALNVSLEHATLRGRGSVIECRYEHLEDPSGSWVITASESAFVMDSDRPLLLFVGSDRPDACLGAIQWSGQGSLVSAETLVAAWRTPGGDIEPISDEQIDVAGLVHSAVQFAGTSDAGPAASRIRRWQAPLRSPEAPGVATEPLHLPH